MAEADNKILLRMLDRLFAGLVSGPNLNCRPHSSRQRVDFSHLERLQDLTSEEVLWHLLGEERVVKLTAKLPTPKRTKKKKTSKPSAEVREEEPKEKPEPDAGASEEEGQNIREPEDDLTPEERSAQQAWSEQQSVLGKMRILAEEARTYEQDTGVHVLNVGYPVLSLPPGTFGATARSTAKRILAPVAFVPVFVTIRSGTAPCIEISCKGEGIDLVSPNLALLAWLEQQTGTPFPEAYADEQGEDPWREIDELVRHVAKVLKLDLPEPFATELARLTAKEKKQKKIGPDQPDTSDQKEESHEREHDAPSNFLDCLKLRAAPRADDGDKPEIVPAAVIGLFPMNNQGILRDMQAMLRGEALDGPVESFIQVGVSLDQPAETVYEHETWSGQKKPRVFADERLVTHSDPCQARAVELARECRGLVIHGPPGTGKSQTITNIIGDHLSRGQRVLMVCDKRTALDVVANRLEHLELGRLCALVHDPRRDQRDLYRTLREQLENLTDVHTDDRAESKLKNIDNELQKLHQELTEYSTLVAKKVGSQGQSLHDLVGQWLSVPAPDGVQINAEELGSASLSEFEQHERELHEILERAEKVGYAEHPWKEAAGIGLEDFLARPPVGLDKLLTDCEHAARAADATMDDSIPPFTPQPTLIIQGKARENLAENVQRVIDQLDRAILSRWTKKSIEAVRKARQRLVEIEPFLQTLRDGKSDVELSFVARSEKLSVSALAQQFAALETYLSIASEWYGFLCFRPRSRAAQVLSKYGLTLSVENAQRVCRFFSGWKARLLLQSIHLELLGKTDDSKGLPSDESLDASLTEHAVLFDVLLKLKAEPALAGLAEPVKQALSDSVKAAGLVAGLRKSVARAEALDRLEKTLALTGVIESKWLQQFMRQSGGPKTSESIARMKESVDSLEGVLRVRHELAKLPAAFRKVMDSLLGKSIGADEAVALLRRTVLEAEIRGRLRADPILQTIDGQRLQGSFERYRRLDQERRTLVRDVILHRWISKQKERLLVGTGSRLNGLGADLKRRLTMRGERALRLRQVVEVGGNIEGGDPLFDLCPVWMASPQTVAQVFARKPLFDVVIFDEASQCRLEEALPVLTRAGRVVIAGDPKQLPPTRFFESAVATSEDEDIDTEQQLFEAHQGEVEDLLTAALSIDIQQCYLDVHYRSQNADLIEFSNEQFYSSRLQPIPGHPSNRSRFAPITLYRANGTYEKRTNPAEAEQVCKIVRDLLRRAEPPSIGIACFNLSQRDLIVEKLDDLAGEDREFASKLADARTRRGAGSFEGLFVKNLENVQGDERDHIVISTTYGPDPQGRFYRRFGPLGRAGGGRRLNVLVTRARAEVHLVTSIPSEIYRNIPPVPAGQAPGGGWLLFAYLAYAEQLAQVYEAAHQTLAETQKARKTGVNVRPSRSPSHFATALAKHLADKHQVGSDVHWGNDGFCVDVALHHPHHPEDVTVGVLCDGARFVQAEDPVEWDIFRTAILESQGWSLHRLWSPHFFRDAGGSVQVILREAEKMLAVEEKKDSIRVVKDGEKGRS